MDRIKGFDGLRALALSLVFLQHYTGLGRDYETGGYGVWLFLALSGFLIVRILVRERQAVEAGGKTARAALRRFFWRRTLRIMPIYYLALGLFSALAALHLVADFTARAAPWHYAYLSNIYFAVIEGRWVGRFGHFWSLAIEEQFYLLAAPALLVAPSRWARPLCGLLVLAALACDLTLRSSGATAMVLYANSLTNFGALAFGGWMALGLPKTARAGSRSWPAALGLCSTIALLVGFHQLGGFPEGTATLIAAAPFWGAALFAAPTLAGLYLNQESRLVRLLEWGPLAYFGRVSYGFYLYHNLLPRRIVGRLSQQAGLHWNVNEGVEALVAFGLALALAALSWRLIERPLLSFKDRPPRLPSWREIVARVRGAPATAVSAEG